MVGNEILGGQLREDDHTIGQQERKCVSIHIPVLVKGLCPLNPDYYKRLCEVDSCVCVCKNIYIYTYL